MNGKNTNYDEFLKTKKIKYKPTGFKVENVNEKLFDFQQDIVKWALMKGKAAIFTGTGTGKTGMQLEWAKHVAEHTKGNVLILAPLAVAEQTVREGIKFGIEVHLCRTQDDVKPGVNISNYEMLHHFDVKSFSGVVLDESSIIKSFGSKTRTQVIESFRNTEYKLACTATPAPNSVLELTNHCEFIGAMSGPEMLSTFFVHDTDGIGQWRLKGHSEEAFWEWMSTWSIMMSNPADLGYDGSKFDLPPLNTNEIIVDKTGYKIKKSLSLNERRAVRKESIGSRVECTEEIITKDLDSEQNKWLIWCNLNAEQHALKKAFGDKCVSIEGATPHDKRLEMEMAWREGDVPVMITKPKVFGFGVNWQHCNKMVFVGLDDSFESQYQATRRCWRFGQTKQVDVYIITSEKEGAVVENIKRKEREFNEMLTGMIAATQEINTTALKSVDLTTDEYNPKTEMIIPTWIKA